MNLKNTVVAIRKYLKTNCPQIITHAEAVGELAQKLAEKHDFCKERALIAGLGHDIYRSSSEAEILKQVELNKNLLKDIYHKNNSYIVYHGPIASLKFKTLFDYNDEEVLRAIKYHTTLSENPSKLEAILFIADKLEPGKNKPNSCLHLEMAVKDLFEGLYILAQDINQYREENNLKQIENIDKFVRLFQNKKSG